MDIELQKSGTFMGMIFMSVWKLGADQSKNPEYGSMRGLLGLDRGCFIISR